MTKKKNTMKRKIIILDMTKHDDLYQSIINIAKSEDTTISGWIRNSLRFKLNYLRLYKKATPEGFIKLLPDVTIQPDLFNAGDTVSHVKKKTTSKTKK